MIGTEKQIKWVENIKANVFKSIQIIRDSKYQYTTVGVRTDELILGGGYAYDPTRKTITETGIDVAEAEFKALFSKIEKASDIIDRRDIFAFDSVLSRVVATSKHFATAESLSEPVTETVTEAAEPTTETTAEPTGRFVAKVAVTYPLTEPDPNAVLIVGELDKLIDEMKQRIESLSGTLVCYLRELLSRSPDRLFSESEIREMASNDLAERDELDKDLDTIQRVRSMYECAMGGIMSPFWFSGDTYEPTDEEKRIINKQYRRFECGD